jgi:tetratricopeptide (TPR) repeat protein
MLLLLLGLTQASDTAHTSQQYSTANQLFSSAQFHEALSLYQKLLLSPPAGLQKSEIQTRIGDTYVRLGLFQNALDAYRTALTDQKESVRPETQYWIGFCCFLLGRDAEAVSEFLKIPELYPSAGMWVGTAYYWAGRASERMGKTDDAAAYYRKAGGNGKSTQGRFARKKADAMKERSTK